MFKNALSKFLWKAKEVKESLISSVQDLTKKTTEKVDSVLKNQESINHNKFSSSIQETTESIKNTVHSIQDSIPLPDNYTGAWDLVDSNENYRVSFVKSKFQHAYKLHKWKFYKVNAKTINRLQKRFVSQKIESNSRNVELNSKYIYTIKNSWKQYSLDIKNWVIVSAINLATQEPANEIFLEQMQTIIDTKGRNLVKNQNNRQFKKKLKAASISEKDEYQITNQSRNENLEKPKMNWSEKHNDAILSKQKREKKQAEKIKQEQYRIEKESNMEQDYKTLFRYQSALSKCNTQWNIVNGSQNTAEFVLKTLAERKGITLNNFQKFLKNQNSFQILKKVLSDYLTIDPSYSAIWKSNRDALNEIFTNSYEIYNDYLYKNKKNDENLKKFYDSLDTNVWSVNNLLKKEKSLKEYENLISILFNNFSYKKYSCKDIFGDISVFEIAIKDLQENESLNSIQSDKWKKASDNIQQFIKILSEKYKNKLDNDVIIHNDKYHKKQLEISNRKKLGTITYKWQFTEKVS